MDVFVLLDRTGSMARRWDEAISSVNAYVAQVRTTMGEDLLTDEDRVTLAAFDRFSNGMDFKVLRDGQHLKAWTPLTVGEVHPRGDTPLLDAVVRIAALAEARKAEKTVLVIMTDGEENASTEATKDTAKAAITRLQDRGWQVVYLGADFDAFAQAQALGIARGQTIAMSAGHFVRGMVSTASGTATYAMTGQDMQYSREDRTAAGERDVTGEGPNGGNDPTSGASGGKT